MFIIYKFTTKIKLFFCAYKVGIDFYGNIYYEYKKTINKTKKRICLYYKTPEASKIPSNWHAWMHYSTDHIPYNDGSSFIHKVNTTGTKYATHHADFLVAITKDSLLKVKKKYKPWIPSDI